MEQLSIYDVGKAPLKIDKPIRLIELFAGVGSQAKALHRIGANFEHYRVCEFDKYAIKSYNAVHGTNFATSDITQITAEDLGIVDTDKYCYIMTYSFPCQDLSLAGKQKGMAKGENTRSGLLWEVERLLNECAELPQVLLMENVTQVHGKKNKEHFDEWIEFLESKGYSNYWQDLNSKNFGIPQNRNRTFMVSVLGDYTYEFPKEFPLVLRLKDMLETEVEEKYYLSAKMLKLHDISRRVYSGEGISPTVHTCGGGQQEPKIVEDFYKNRDARVYEGVSPTLRSGRDGLKVVEPKCIGGIGEKKSNGGTQWYQQDRIYDNECAMSVTTGFLPYYKTEEPTIKKVDIPQTVRVRKYEVDCKLLCEMLRDYKCSSGFNNQDIADQLNVPLTKVEHWFRQDKYFAIPDEDIWFKLKALLGIETTEFDDAIMTFEEKEGVFEKSNRCYLSDGLAPTITSASADEKVFEPLAYDEQNGYIRQDGTVGTLTTDGSSPKHNNRVIVRVANKKGYDEAVEGDSINLEQPNSTTRRGRVGHGVAQTLNTAPQQAVVEPLGVWDGFNQRVRADSTSVGTLTRNCGADLKRNGQGIIESPLRIRKLTPKECWRLMGFDDADFEKAAQVNSNSQLYKQAGNSIVVDVLEYIFMKML